MKKDRILYVIITGSMFDHRVKSIKKTWCKNINYILYSDHEDVSENIVKVSNRTDYHSNEEKQINMINKITDEYDWYFFCDDDTFVNTRLVDKILNQLDKQYVYSRIINEDNNPDNPVFKNPIVPKGLCYMEGGTGYFISQQTIQKIKPFKNYNVGYADVSIGLNLYYNDVEIKDMSVYDENFKISYHFMKTFDQMNEMYNLVNS